MFLLFFLPLSFGNEVCVLLPAVRPAWGASQPPRSPNTLSQIWQQSLVTSHTFTQTHTYTQTASENEVCLCSASKVPSVLLYPPVLLASLSLSFLFLPSMLQKVTECVYMNVLTPIMLNKPTMRAIMYPFSFIGVKS